MFAPRSRPPALPVRVVLVGEVDDLRWVLRLALERHGAFEVVAEAASGAVAVAAALTTAPDLVVADLDLPGGAALEVVRRLTRECPDVAVVVLSGMQDHQAVAAALEAGAAGVLRKGTRLSVIAERARAFAEERRAS